MSIINTRKIKHKWKKYYAGRGLRLAELVEKGVNYSKSILGENQPDKVYPKTNMETKKRKGDVQLKKKVEEETKEMKEWVLKNAKNRK